MIKKKCKKCEWSVNYFVNLRVGRYLLKIRCKKSNYTKHQRYQCNLLKTFQQQTITNLQSIKTKPKNSNNNNDKRTSAISL